MTGCYTCKQELLNKMILRRIVQPASGGLSINLHYASLYKKHGL